MDVLSPSSRRKVLDDYLRLAEESEDLQPAPLPFPYRQLPALHDLAWRIFLAPGLIEDDLQELTNGLNQWKGSLRQWHAWTKALASLDEDTRWGTEIEFVAPLAFMNMFMPSSTRDRFGYIATRAMHQVLLSLDSTRDDLLVGDAQKPGKRARFVSRKDQEDQLAEMVEKWPEGKAFMIALQNLDGKSYADTTGNFRNKASHALAPRFTLGFVETVTRHRRQAIKIQVGVDGHPSEQPVPDKMSAVYTIGGTPPLDMDVARLSNLAQFELAKICFETYVALLRSSIAGIAVQPE